MTPFEQFMETVPEEHWDLQALGRSKNISFRFIEKYAHLNWDWAQLSYERKNIPKSIILKFKDKWDWDYLSVDVSPDIVERYTDFPWNWGAERPGSYTYGLTCNPNVTPAFITKYVDKPWNWDHLSLYYPKLTKEFLTLHSDRLNWNHIINRRYELSFELYLAFPEKNWNMVSFSHQHDFTPEFIEKHMDKNWWICNVFFYSNPGFTAELVERFIDKPWSWSFMHEVRGVTLDFVRRYPDKPWCWRSVENIVMDKSKTVNQNVKHRHAMWVYSGFLYDNLLCNLLR